MEGEQSSSESSIGVLAADHYRPVLVVGLQIAQAGALSLVSSCFSFV